MPVLGEDNKPVSAFSALTSLPAETQKDYYHYLLVEMDQLDNALGRMRYEHDMPVESYPFAYTATPIINAQDTRDFAQTLASSEYEGDSAERHFFEQIKADRYYNSLKAFTDALDLQEQKLRDLMEKRDVMNDTSPEDEEDYKKAVKTYQDAEAAYKKNYLPDQTKALRMEHIHLPELEVELANLTALKRSAARVLECLPGALTANGLGDPENPDKDIPIADVRNRIQQNVNEMHRLEMDGFGAKHKASVPAQIDVIRKAHEANKISLQASQDIAKQQPENWYLNRKGEEKQKDLENILDRLYTPTDKARKDNSTKYKKMVEEAEKLQKLLETKRGKDLGTAENGELRSQITEARRAAEEYRQAKSKQFRPFPTDLRTRRLEESEKLLNMLDQMEKELDKVGPEIDAETKTKANRLEWECRDKIDAVQREFRKPVVSKLQTEMAKNIEDKFFAAEDPDDVINISAEQNRRIAVSGIKKTGPKGRTRMEINSDLAAGAANELNAQLEEGAKKQNVTVLDYKKMIRKSKPESYPVDFDNKRKVTTEKLVKDFRKFLKKSGVSEDRYAQMTQNFASRDPEEVRQGLRELNALGDLAAQKEPDAAKKKDVKTQFIEKAIRNSTYMFEYDINDCADMVKQASKMKLVPSALGTAEAEDTALKNLSKANELKK